MHPEAIALFRAQVEGMVQQGDPLVLRDAHAQDGVLMDLGYIVEASIDESFHLVIKAELDEDNPAAVALWKKLQKGKQFGLSIGGRVIDYIDEYVETLGKTVRTYLNVLLNEISVTTRPAWQPSFGTVMSKSIDEATAASLTKEGANRVEDEELQPGQDVAPDAAVKSEELVTPAADETQKADEEVALPEGVIETLEDGTPVVRSEDDNDTDVEKAGRRVSAATRREMLSAFEAHRAALVALGLLDDGGAPEKSVSGDEESPLVKSLRDSVTAEKDISKALQKSLDEATARIEELEKTPAAQPPAVLAKAKDEADETIKALFKLSPSERLAIALQLND